jgi:predicted transcriptional regulator
MLLKGIDEEEIVFSAVQDYLNRNKILDKSNVLFHIKSYFTKISVNINEQGIIKHLESLVRKKRIIEGSKLTKDSVLDNKIRNKIYRFIIKKPGIYFNKIVKGLKLSNHVVYWHISILLKFALIKKTKVESHEIFFISKLESTEAKKLYFTTVKEKSKEIFKYLKMDELGITPLRLASVLQMHPKTIKKYLDYFEELDMVEKKKISTRDTLYFIRDG